MIQSRLLISKIGLIFTDVTQHCMRLRLCVIARSLNWLPIVNFMGVVKLLWTGTVSDRADKLSVFPTRWTTLYPNGF
jgi:hypothetical protein